MPPRRNSAALVRMNPTREDEAYKKEILSKANEGFRAELTTGKSERITQNLKNQDEGTLRLQEYLMAAEVNARPPAKIESLMDQSDAIKLQKSLTALQVAPLQRSQVQDVPRYEVTSESSGTVSSYNRQSSPSIESSQTTLTHQSTLTPPTASPMKRSPKAVPKDVPKPIPIREEVLRPQPKSPPVVLKRSSPVVHHPVVQQSQEDEYTDEYVMVKQRVKRRPHQSSKLASVKVSSSKEPGFLYAYRKSWGFAEYCYASTCGLLALMVLFIFSYLLMRLWTGCTGLGLVSHPIVLPPLGGGNVTPGTSCTGLSIQEIQALLDRNNKYLLKEWSNAAQVTAKLLERQEQMETGVMDAIKKIKVIGDGVGMSASQMEKLARTVRSEISEATKERVSSLSATIVDLKKELVAAQSTTDGLLRNLTKNIGSKAATSTKAVSQQVKTVVDRVVNATESATKATAAELSNFTAVLMAIEALSHKIEKSPSDDLVAKSLKATQQALALEVQTQLKDAAAQTAKIIDTSLTDIRTQTEGLYAKVSEVLARVSSGTASSSTAGEISTMGVAAEMLISMQRSIDTIVSTLNTFTDANKGGLHNEQAHSSGLTLADLEEMQKKTMQHVSEQTHNVTSTILERIDFSDNKLESAADARENRLKTGLAGIIKSFMTKAPVEGSSSTASHGVADELRLKYTDFAKQIFGTRIAGKSDDVTNIAENLKSFVSGNDRIRLLFNEDLSPGSCWPTLKKGYIVFRFKHPVTLYYSSISHPAAPKLPTGRLSAPHNLTFVGRTTSGQNVPLGMFTFEEDGPEQQAFRLQQNTDIIQVKVEFTNNGGDYTCVYNMGLFGERDDKKERRAT